MTVNMKPWWKTNAFKFIIVASLIMFIYAKYQDYTVMDRQSRYKLLFPLMYDDGTPVTLPEHRDTDHVFGSHCDTSHRIAMVDARHAPPPRFDHQP